MPSATRLFASPKRSGALVFLILLICYGYFFPRWADWNQNSRFDLVMAVVDEHTLQIDNYVANTGDYAEFNNHFYSDKAPGIALLGIPVYAAFERVIPAHLLTPNLVTVAQSGSLAETLDENGTGVTADKLYTFIALIVTTFFTVAVPAALLGVALFWFVGFLGWTIPQRLTATFAYGLATSAFPYANSFVGHQTVAALLFGAFAMVFAIRRHLLGRRWLFMCGLLLGYAVVTEYPTALIAAVIGLYALCVVKRPLQTVIALVAGAIPAVLALALHDIAAFGTPLPVGYFHSALWSDVHETGFVSLTYPHLDALWGITFGVHRGLFFLSPFLLFATPGYFHLWRRSSLRSEFWALLLVPVIFLLFNASSAMWQGGFAVGPRYIVASLPFLAVAAGQGLQACWSQLRWRPIIVAALAWSLCAVWAETIGGQSFPDYSPNPLLDLDLPLLLRGDIARNAGMAFKLSGWLSVVPLVALVVLAGMACGSQILSRREPEAAPQLNPSSRGALLP